MIESLVSDERLDKAYAWLCHQRKDFPANSDIWDFRFNWHQEKESIRIDLLNGRYCMRPLTRITKQDGEEIDIWSSRDALVLKALTGVLSERIEVSKQCTHVKGHGGAKSAIRQVVEHLPSYKFVLRTDVKSFYASIDHFLLLEQLAKVIPDKPILNLLWQYMRRFVDCGGNYYEHDKGISLGCPLSPLMGALFLKLLDERMEGLGVFYVRYMDDILVLAPTHRKLRLAVRTVNQALAELKLEKHQDKTFIGKVEREFDFLGYRFGRNGLSPAKATLEKFASHIRRLYEQKRGQHDCHASLWQYVKRWIRWVFAGLSSRCFQFMVVLPASPSNSCETETY
jgi:hypothetical protein